MHIPINPYVYAFIYIYISFVYTYVFLLTLMSIYVMYKNVCTLVCMTEINRERMAPLILVIVTPKK